MKRGIAGALSVATIGLFLSLLPQAQGNEEIYWDFDDGFSPRSVEIAPGETVVWWNVDPFGFDVRITFDNSFTFFLPNLTGAGVTFPFAGTYGFHSDFGDNGSVTVSIPTPPALSLEFPRQEGTQFLFDVTGLTVGKTNVLQASTNLTSWVGIATNLADSTTMTFTNSTALPRRFFRLLELP